MKSQMHARKAPQRFAAFLFAAVVLLGGTAPAFAQDTGSSATRDAAARQQLSRQLIASLDSPVIQIQQQTLQHINFFATYHKSEIDLSEAVPKLIEIFETDAHEGLRILALTSLNAIGDQSIMRYLSETVRWEPSPRVRALTLAALAGYAAKEQTL